MIGFIAYTNQERKERERKTKKKEMGEGERFQLGTVGALTLSVVSSVSIVICNKALISSLGFHFGMFTFYDVFIRYMFCSNMLRYLYCWRGEWGSCNAHNSLPSDTLFVF